MSVPSVGGSSLGDRLRRLTTLERVHLIAALAAVVAVFIPWLRGRGDSANATDVPAVFLINSESTDLGFRLSVLALLAAGAALLAFFVRVPAMRHVLLGSAIALIAMGAQFTIQVNRVISGTLQSITDVIGPGPIVLIVAGVALFLVAKRQPKPSPPTTP